MTKFCVILFAGFFMNANISANTNIVQVTTQNGVLGYFNEVLIDVPADIKLIESKTTEYGYTISAESHVIKAITFKVNGKKLEVKAKQDFKTDKPVSIQISLAEIAALKTDGSVNVVSTVPTHPDRFTIDLNGASDIQQQFVRAKTTLVNLQGSGTVTMFGKTQQLRLVLSGSADANFLKFDCQDADVSITGSGTVNILAQRSLKASISGAGEIIYSGKPKVEHHISGAGEVRAIR